jgi:carbamoyltransferase
LNALFIIKVVVNQARRLGNPWLTCGKLFFVVIGIREFMNVLGISGLDNSVPFKKREFPRLSSRHYRIAQGFDSAAALVTSQGIQAAAAEERFTRERATGSFPINAIHYCLEAGDVTAQGIDYVAHGFCYEPLKSFYEQDEFLRKEFAEVYSREAQINCAKRHLPSWDWNKKLVHVAHHTAHAASAFYLSGFDECLILVSDGMGECHSATVAVGRGNEIQTIKQFPGMHSLGILYGVFTLYLGFYMGLDEYKVMGLAAYGNPRRFFTKLMDLVHLKNDGTYEIPVLLQNRSLEEKQTYAGTIRLMTERFGLARKPESDITQSHMDIAAALQAVLQTSVMHVLQYFKKETGQSYLCMAGGVTLNCSVNGALNRSRIFKGMFVQPAAGDDGTALGAALYVQRCHEPKTSYARMSVPLWGPEYDNERIAAVIKARADCCATEYLSFDALVEDVTKRLAQGEIVGWFQGRMEFGPRALGSRSILADPRDSAMRSRINHLVKKREEFRPFAPAVTAETAAQYFDIHEGEEQSYAHMLFVTQVRKQYQCQLPAVTHVDGSARVQTVQREDNPRFWALLNAFGKAVGLPILLNTSFNVRGQPIVCTPDEAVDTFLSARLHALAIGNYVVVPLTDARPKSAPQSNQI